MKDQPAGTESQPLISVVIPVYNVKKYMKRCLDGVLAQTYKNLEIILVDDGSTDGSAKICDDYFKKDKRVVVFHKPNGGLSSARNYGVRSSNGKYVTFIDSDDSVDEDYVETLYNIIVKYKVKLAICSHRVIYENRTPIDMSTGESGALESKLVLKRLLYADGIDISSWAKMFAREILIPHPFPEGRNFEDAATTYLYVDSVDKVGLNSVPKYNYYIRKKSISNANFTKMKMDLITSTTEMHDYICEKYPRMKAAAERRLMYAYLSTLRQIALSPVSADSEECLPIIWQYIKSHRNAILRDTNIPARDRHALNATKLGYKFFRFELKWYEKMRHLLT
jgi:glycosyltransferase involved in cell wall biosynthesis